MSVLIVFIVIAVIVEFPFFFKFLKAKENYDITRQVAILVIMFINALIIFGLYKLILMIK